MNKETQENPVGTTGESGGGGTPKREAPKVGIISSTKDVLLAIKGLKEDLGICRQEIERITGEKDDFQHQLETKTAEFNALWLNFEDVTKKAHEGSLENERLEKELAEAGEREEILSEDLAEAGRSLEEIKKALEIWDKK